MHKIAKNIISWKKSFCKIRETSSGYDWRCPDCIFNVGVYPSTCNIKDEALEKMDNYILESFWEKIIEFYKQSAEAVEGSKDESDS